MGWGSRDSEREDFVKPFGTLAAAVPMSDIVADCTAGGNCLSFLSKRGMTTLQETSR